MADSELQDLTADTAPASGDIVYVVVDPAGTPLARKMTVENLLKAVHLLSELTTSTTDTDKLLIGNSLEGTWAKYITPENLFKSIVALTVDTAPTTDDVVLTVNNPGGTAASRYATIANLMKAWFLDSEGNPADIGTAADGSSTYAARRDHVHGPIDGWIADGATWTYVSATTFTVSGDVTAQFRKGTKLKLTQTTAKYFYVIGSSYGAPNTTVTITGGTDYTLANAAITLPYYSYQEAPQGFPDWFAYTPTFTGYAAGTPESVSRFRISGKAITWALYMTGGGPDSNATTFTATLPVTAATVSGMVWYGALGYCYDNGAFAANGMFELVSGGTTVAFFKSARTGWTAAGDKATGFVQTYEF